MLSIKKYYLLLALLLIGIHSTFAQLSAVEINQSLQKGINLGNLFEAPTETAWGNTYDQKYFKLIAEKGFKHVRIPIRWDTPERTQQASPYTINPAFLAQINTVITDAQSAGLKVIINMHHHEKIFENPAAEKQKFLAQWTQIADYFKTHEQDLLFEVLNEPHGSLSPTLWNGYFAEALSIIRNKNPSRIVLIGTANYGGLGGLADLKIPDDKYLIVSIHYYDPFPFTHQGAEWVDGSNAWLGTPWQGNFADRAQISSQFSYLNRLKNEQNLPIHIGEFGAYAKAEASSRYRWTAYLSRWFEQQGYSWAYWEFNSGFGIYNNTSGTFDNELTAVLISTPIEELPESSTTSILKSDFENDRNDWFLAKAGGAEGSVNYTDKKASINLSNGGTEGWHAQFIRQQVPVLQNQTYLLSFMAESKQAANIGAYVGKNGSPWNSYSGYPNFNINSLPTTYISTFTMTDPSDLQARLVVDLGKNFGEIKISEVELLRIDNLNTVLGKPLDSEDEFRLYPVPSSGAIFIKAPPTFKELKIFSENGQLIMGKKISEGGLEKVDLKKGHYIIRIENDQGKQSKRVFIY